MDDLFSLNFWGSTPWFQQISSLLTIVAIPYALFRFIIYKAKHKISFQPKETYQEVTLVDYPSNPKSVWLHLMVKNKGFEISKNAEAYISQIWTKNRSNSFSQLKEFRAPVKLKWAHEAAINPIDILPRYSRRLDVCFICEGEQVLHLESEGFPSGTIKNALEFGEYIFETVVVSENSLRPARLLFNVQWDGKWRNIKGCNYVRSFVLGSKPIKSFSLYD